MSEFGYPLMERTIGVFNHGMPQWRYACCGGIAPGMVRQPD